MRTTLDIEKPVLEGLKRLQTEEKTSLGNLASRLLAEALHRRTEDRRGDQAELPWIAADLGAAVDLADKDAVYRALDSGQ